jgi:hypothetical protein
MWQPVTSGPPRESLNAGPAFAIIERDLLVALARVSPDAQSAVLLCLAWQASFQKRMERGPLAGQLVAKLSGQQLAEMTGRSIRTVRHALSRLTQTGRIKNDQAGHGKKAVYGLNLSPSARDLRPGVFAPESPASTTEEDRGNGGNEEAEASRRNRRRDQGA